MVRRARPAAPTSSPRRVRATSGPTPRSGARRRRDDVAALAAITPGGLGVDGRAAAGRRRAAAEQHRPRPRALPRLHPGGAGDGGRAVRRRRRRVVVLRRELAGGRCRRGRRERRARLAAVARRPARRALPAASCPAARRATSAASPSPATSGAAAIAARRTAGRRLRAVGPLVGAQRRGAARPRRRRGARRRARPAHRRARARRMPVDDDGSAPSSPAPVPPTPASSTTSTAWPTCAPSAWRVAPRRRRLRRRRPVRARARRTVRRHRTGRLARRSIRTSGCSPRSTAPPCCTAIPAAAARTHRQSAAYLDAFGDAHVNPSDLAFHLTRRARGLPFWFALVVHGTDAYAAAVRAGVDAGPRMRPTIVRRARRAGAPGDGARAVGRAVRARRLDPRRLGPLGGRRARRRPGVRRPDPLAATATSAGWPSSTRAPTSPSAAPSPTTPAACSLTARDGGCTDTGVGSDVEAGEVLDGGAALAAAEDAQGDDGEHEGDRRADQHRRRHRVERRRRRAADVGVDLDRHRLASTRRRTGTPRSRSRRSTWRTRSSGWRRSPGRAAAAAPCAAPASAWRRGRGRPPRGRGRSSAAGRARSRRRRRSRT